MYTRLPLDPAERFRCPPWSHVILSWSMPLSKQWENCSYEIWDPFSPTRDNTRMGFLKLSFWGDLIYHNFLSECQRAYLLNVTTKYLCLNLIQTWSLFLSRNMKILCVHSLNRSRITVSFGIIRPGTELSIQNLIHQFKQIIWNQKKNTENLYIIDALA